jgi:hypothetical protein
MTRSQAQTLRSIREFLATSNRVCRSGAMAREDASAEKSDSILTGERLAFRPVATLVYRLGALGISGCSQCVRSARLDRF